MHYKIVSPLNEKLFDLFCKYRLIKPVVSLEDELVIMTTLKLWHLIIYPWININVGLVLVNEVRTSVSYCIALKTMRYNYLSMPQSQLNYVSKSGGGGLVYKHWYIPSFQNHVFIYCWYHWIMIYWNYGTESFLNKLTQSSFMPHLNAYNHLQIVYEYAKMTNLSLLSNCLCMILSAVSYTDVITSTALNTAGFNVSLKAFKSSKICHL